MSAAANRLFIVLFLALALLPLTAGLSYALAYSLGLTGALQEGLTSDHWLAVLADLAFWRSAVLSLVVAAGVVLVSAVLALGFVLAFHRELSGSPVRFGLYWPLAVPPVVAAFWGFQLLGNSGLLARAAAMFGWISEPQDFPNLINAPGQVGILAVLTMSTFPFFSVVLYQFYRSAQVPQLMAVARTLGATHGQAVWKVAAPVLMQRLRPVLVLYGIFLFGAYEVPLLLGSQSERMISILIAQKFRRFDLLELPQAYVITVLYAVVVLLALISLRPGREKEGQAL